MKSFLLAFLFLVNATCFAAAEVCVLQTSDDDKLIPVTSTCGSKVETYSSANIPSVLSLFVGRGFKIVSQSAFYKEYVGSKLYWTLVKE